MFERKPRRPTMGECSGFLAAAVAVMGWMLPDLPWALGLNAKAEHLGATLPLFVLLCVAGTMTYRLGHTFAEIQAAALHGIMLALPAVLVLLVVGGLIGVWLAAGTISSLIDVGLDVLSARFFLPASLLVCSVVSLSSGSSWTTAATMGVALMGVGQTLGIYAPLTAGAIVSGAYFGDKLSPLSETTNLAPGIAGVDLFDHIRGMMITTIPSYLIAFAAFTFVGLRLDTTALATVSDVAGIQETLATQSSSWLLLPPVVVLALALSKAPAIPALLAGVAAGIGLALVVRGMPFVDVLLAFLQGFETETGNATLDALLSGGGMESMLYTALLIMTATALGGILEKGGFLEVVLERISRRVKRPGGVVLATLGTAVGSNVLLSDQYLAIVLPGRLFRAAYPRVGLSPRMLSRSLEDAGTLSSPLIPWNSCGAFMAGALGVPTVQYLPFCFLNLANLGIAVLFAWFGWFLYTVDPPAIPPEEEGAVPAGTRR